MIARKSRKLKQFIARDQYVSRVMIHWGMRNKVTRLAVRYVAQFGPHVFFAEMALWVTYCLLFAQDQMASAVLGVGCAVAAALLSKLIVDAIAKRVFRHRPFVRFGIIPLVKKSSRDPSFPSNHAGGAFALAVGLALWVPSLALISLLFAVLLASARVLAGLHYVADVVFGGIIGGLLALLVTLLIRAM